MWSFFFFWESEFEIAVMSNISESKLEFIPIIEVELITVYFFGWDSFRKKILERVGYKSWDLFIVILKFLIFEVVKLTNMNFMILFLESWTELGACNWFLCKIEFLSETISMSKPISPIELIKINHDYRILFVQIFITKNIQNQ